MSKRPLWSKICRFFMNFSCELSHRGEKERQKVLSCSTYFSLNLQIFQLLTANKLIIKKKTASDCCQQEKRTYLNY